MTTTIIKHWLIALFAALLGITLGVFGGLGIVHAAPLEIPYANHATNPTGTVTVAVDGVLYGMEHGHGQFNDGGVFRDECDMPSQERAFFFTVVIRPALTVTNIATGESYRLHGKFSYDGDYGQISTSHAVCNNVLSMEFDGTVLLVGKDAVIPYRMRFYVEIDTLTGDLIHYEVVSAELL